MNAQSNFQQFVSSNKDNLITFKHQGATVSKYVVDICGEYFTAKGRQTDAKIDGFYYFAECEMYNRSLIETLAYHKYVVLIGDKSPMPDVFFEYQYSKVVSDALMVMGKQLSAANPDVGYTASYIGEVWAIVEGKYTQVWKKTIDRLLINGDDLKKIGVKKEIGGPESGASGPEDEIKKQKIQWYKENADDWIELCGKNGTFKADKFMYVLGKIKTEPYSEALYNELCSSYEGLRDYILGMFKENYYRKSPRVQALTKRFLVLTNEFREKFRNKDVHKLLDLINEEISIEGENEYERLFGKKEEQSKVEEEKRNFQLFREAALDWIGLCEKYGTLYKETVNFIKTMEKVKVQPYSVNLYNELCCSYECLKNLFIEKYNNDSPKDPIKQALIKRFLVLSNNLIEKIGNLDELMIAELSFEGENEYERLFGKKENATGSPVNIEHRGKTKTVEIVNDNVLINKKEYVLAKDCKDGTPMALLKKNIKYMDEDKPVDIEYRGKAKTVEIMNEYTHKNGKEYVWVKDLTDNGKTKTLFKEYIKYM